MTALHLLPYTPPRILLAYLDVAQDPQPALDGMPDPWHRLYVWDMELDWEALADFDPDLVNIEIQSRAVFGIPPNYADPADLHTAVYSQLRRAVSDLPAPPRSTRYNIWSTDAVVGDTDSLESHIYRYVSDQVDQQLSEPYPPVFPVRAFNDADQHSPYVTAVVFDVDRSHEPTCPVTLETLHIPGARLVELADRSSFDL